MVANPRRAGLDAVRVIAMVAVVAGHVWVEPWARLAFYTWNVSLFFFVSGYLWGPTRTASAVVRTRFRTLLVPYATWFVLVALLAWPIQAAQGTFEIQQALRAAWGGRYLGTPFWAFWFVTALFVASVLYAVLARYRWWVRLAVIVTGTVLAVYLPGQPFKFLPLGIGLGIVGMLFLGAGHGLQRVRASLGAPVAAGVVLLLLGAGIAFALGPDHYIDIKFSSLGFPVLSVVASVSICSGMVLIGEGVRFSERAGRVVSLLARASLVVLFVHVPVLWLLGGLEEGRFGDFMIALAVSWALGLLLLRVPAAWPLTGSRPVANA